MNIPLAMDIATRVQDQERKNAAALGHDDLDVFLLGVEAWGQAFDLATQPPRPTTLTRFRPMGTK